MSWQRRQYAAWVATMDESVGKVLDAVDSLGLRERTIVVFLSDHGYSVEARANYGGGNAGPFRGHKFTVWEGGIRVPCIVSWPGKIPQGEVRGQMAVSVDWFPTLCAYCGIKHPERILDGYDIRNLIASGEAPTPHKVFGWEFGGMWAVRKGKWKLVAEKKNRDSPYSYFLSDMFLDVSETKNIAGRHPQVVEDLKALHEKWRRDVTRNR